MNVSKTADRLKARAKSEGYKVRTHCACETKSIYLALTRDDLEVKIRVSDHSQVYIPQRGELFIVVSPDEGSVVDAIKAIKDPFSITPYDAPAETKRQLKADAVKKNNRRQTLNALIKAYPKAMAKYHELTSGKGYGAQKHSLAVMPSGLSKEISKYWLVACRKYSMAVANGYEFN
jgi:hypothetical protein